MSRDAPATEPRAASVPSAPKSIAASLRPAISLSLSHTSPAGSRRMRAWNAPASPAGSGSTIWSASSDSVWSPGERMRSSSSCTSPKPVTASRRAAMSMGGKRGGTAATTSWREGGGSPSSIVGRVKSSRSRRFSASTPSMAPTTSPRRTFHKLKRTSMRSASKLSSTPRSISESASTVIDSMRALVIHVPRTRSTFTGTPSASLSTELTRLATRSPNKGWRST